jgi:hypothetical protein
MLRQRCAQGFHLCLLLGIDEATVITKRLISRGDGDLVGEQGDPEIAERGSLICIEKTLFFA